MAVRKDQINELVEIIQHHVVRDAIPALLAELKTSNAYATNSSFKATIDRLEKALQS
jgi:hypothetical protein